MINLDPVTQFFIDKLASDNVPPHEKLSIEEARRFLLQTQADYEANHETETQDVLISSGYGGVLKVKLIRPRIAQGVLPLVMYFHGGGGWSLGSFRTHERVVRKIAIELNATVGFLEYSLAPDARYPVQIEEAYAATEYLIAHAIESQIDQDKFALVGDGAGGNLVAAVSLMSKSRQGHLAKCQVLIYPIADANMDDSSFEEFQYGPWLSKMAMEAYWNAYLPDNSKKNLITVSPLRATLEELRGLPPALVIVAENDVLREQAETYARNLAWAGVETAAIRYLGTIHDFMILDALAESPASKCAIAQVCAYLRMRLHS